MIFRLSIKLATKLNASPSQVLPQDANPFADWSAHMFVAERTQFLIVTNTASLYSTLLNGRGISSESQFVEQALISISECMKNDELDVICQRFIASAGSNFQYSKALNRSVTGSMTDMIFHAKMWMIEVGLSPYETACKLNDIPFSSLKYRKPREVLIDLAARCSD